MSLDVYHKTGGVPSTEKHSHWRIQGGAPGTRPPTGSNSFIFADVFTEKQTCRQLAPPQQVGAPQRKILDPPLFPVL